MDRPIDNLDREERGARRKVSADRNSNTMLIKGKGLFPAKGHEWEFVTHVDHNESSLRGHNVEPRVLPSLFFFFSLELPSLESVELHVHEQEETFLSLQEEKFPRWAHCRRVIHHEVATDPIHLFVDRVCT